MNTCRRRKRFTQSVISPVMWVMFFLSHFGATLAAAAQPIQVLNPKELEPPVKLIWADCYMDGGSLAGKLRDEKGRLFLFFVDRSDSYDRPHGLYIGFVNGIIPISAKARFVGWTLLDFCSLLQKSIRNQFVLDASNNQLTAKNPDDFRQSEVSLRFTCLAAEGLLHWAEVEIKKGH